MGTNVNTETITLQTTLEENIKLTRTLINNLSREGELGGFQNLIDSGTEFLSTDFRQDGVHGAIAIPADFAEQRTYGVYERSHETCRIIKLTVNRKNW